MDVHAVSPTVAPDLNAVLAALTAGIRATWARSCSPSTSRAPGRWGTPTPTRTSTGWPSWLAPSRRADAALEDLHRRLYALPSPWAQHLEGSYARSTRFAPTTPPAPWPYLDNGSQELVPSDHDNTRVVRWTLYECGVALWGPAPRTLIAPCRRTPSAPRSWPP